MSDQDFMISRLIHSNFLASMHGFRDNEVVLPTGYDVIVSSSPGGAARTFLRTLDERPCMVYEIIYFHPSSNWKLSAQGFHCSL